MFKLNGRYLFLTFFLLLIEITIALFLRDDIIRPYVGDVLVVMLLYCAVRAVVSKPPKFLPLYLFIFAACVEASQLFNLVSLLHLENIAVLRIALGSVFSWADMLCYAAGAAICAGLTWLDARRGKIVAPLFLAAAVVSVATLAVLAYNGLWWPVNPARLGYTVKGIDVSRYQGSIDWQAIAAQGVTFAYIKTTEGSSYTDPFLDKNIRGAQENGIADGAYHYFSTQSGGKTQADNFLAAVAPYHLSLPPALDFEIAPGADKDAVVANVKIFLQEVQSRTGVAPIIYTTRKCFYAYLSQDFNDYGFWFRDLLREPKIDGVNVVMWQYCNRGQLLGIDLQNYVDLDVFVK